MGEEERAGVVYTRVVKTFTFHAGHRLPNHKGKCRRLHGHTYRVDVGVLGLVVQSLEGRPDEGMVLDFDIVKAAWTPVGEMLDHRFLLDSSDPFRKVMQEQERESVVIFHSGPPTAENIASLIWDRLIETLTGPEYTLDLVRVWETPTSYAEVHPSDG